MARTNDPSKRARSFEAALEVAHKINAGRMDVAGRVDEVSIEKDWDDLTTLAILLTQLGSLLTPEQADLLIERLKRQPKATD